VEGGVELVVRGGAAGWEAEPLLAAVPELSGVWHVPSSRASPEEGSPRLAGGSPSPGGGTAFEQVNRSVAGLLREHVLALCGAPREQEEHDGSAIDAYCGSGHYGRALAGLGWQTVGVEADHEAAGVAASDAPRGFRVVEGRVEEQLPLLLPCDLLVLNPPRGGLAAGVVPAILDALPRSLVYVSCDPATLARDLGALSDAYELEHLRAFDLFPRTAHVETVAGLGIRTERR
jgi:23S rRNA (uracil1939-C5)-methyltransferase